MDLSTFLELFTWPLVALALAAIVGPLVGAFLHVRGTTFHGIALPQVAACGVALGFAVAPHVAPAIVTLGSGEDAHVHGDHLHYGTLDPSRAYLLLSAGLAVALAMAALAWRRRGAPPGSETARVAAVFAFAAGATVIASRYSPRGGLHVEALLSGDALASGPLDALLLAAALAAVLLAVVSGWRTLTVAGRDAEFAHCAGGRPRRANLLLDALTGTVIVIGSLTVGALVMFALLVIPAIAAHGTARSMARYLVLAPLLGLAGASLGAGFAFWLDWPMDAGTVAGTGTVALVTGGRAAR